MCSIGRTHGEDCPTVEYLEKPGKLKENYRDNLFGPLTLASVADELGIKTCYIGTGCIFQYDMEHKVGDPGYTEKDLPNFFGSSYSKVKGCTDTLIQMIPSVLNLRIRMPISYDDSPRNFIWKITHYAKICSIQNSMTVLEEMIPIVLDMMRKGTTGTFNLTNPGSISHNEILEMYRDIVNPGFTWENFSLEEQKALLKAERSNNTLDTRKLEKEYPQVLHIHDAVEKTLKIMKLLEDSDKMMREQLE